MTPKIISDDIGNIRSDTYGKLPSEIGTDHTYKTKIVWFNVIGFLVLHIAALYGLYLCIYAKGITLIYTSFMILFSAEGVMMGAHRLYSHKAFKAKYSLRLALIILQTVAGQNCLFIWARDHRLHHKYSDTDADPHNATRGFFYSHMGWLMTRKHPAVISKGRTIDLSDLKEDEIVMFQKKHYKWMYLIFAIIIPVAIPYYLWKEDFSNALFISYFVRYVSLLHFTWFVNSYAHFFGTKPYDKSIRAVESMFVGLLAVGEGWHNYHHAFPWDYRAAEHGVRYSLTTFFIDVLAHFGLAYDLRDANSELVKNKSIRIGDGTHPIYGSEEPNEDFLDNDNNFAKFNAETWRFAAKA